MEGSADLIVDNGKILKEAMQRNNLSNADLFRLLRKQGVKYLGEVDKAFFEISGDISIWKKNGPTENGLILLPTEELPPDAVVEENTATKPGLQLSCIDCGERISSTEHPRLPQCPQCGNDRWLMNEAMDS